MKPFLKDILLNFLLCLSRPFTPPWSLNEDKYLITLFYLAANVLLVVKDPLPPLYHTNRLVSYLLCIP